MLRTLGRSMGQLSLEKLLLIWYTHIFMVIDYMMSNIASNMLMNNAGLRWDERHQGFGL